MSKFKIKPEKLEELKSLKDAAIKASDAYAEFMQISITAGVPDAEEVMQSTHAVLQATATLLEDAYNESVGIKTHKFF